MNRRAFQFSLIAALPMVVALWACVHVAPTVIAQKASHPVVDRIMLDVTQTITPGLREIKIDWAGQPEESILVVNIDYGVGRQRRSEGRDIARVLHDAVLFRKIGSEGSAFLKVDEGKLDLVNGPNFQGELKVFVVRQLQVRAFEDFDEAKPRRKEIGRKVFKAADCANEFQLVGNQNGSRLSAAIPDIAVAKIETTDKGYPEAFVSTRSPGSFAIAVLRRADGSMHGDNIVDLPEE